MELVMAMVSSVGAGLEVMYDMHVGQSQGGWSYVRRFESIS